MVSTAAALYQFFSGFSLPAFAENTVPDDQPLPYITYSVAEPEWNQKSTMNARVWDRATSNRLIFQKADEIASAIGEGLRLTCEGGYVVIWPETPLVQMYVGDDFRSAYINLSINAYHMPGM